MTTAIIHLSDFHFRNGQHENFTVVLDALFKDLQVQIPQLHATNIYLAFSGDIVNAGENKDQYTELSAILDSKLNDLGIEKRHRICVPGNHDLSTATIQKNPVEHEGVVAQDLGESAFNDYVSKHPRILEQKFDNYVTFEEKFAQFGVTRSRIAGRGWAISSDVGIYCLNTALCSVGGQSSFQGKQLSDKRRLAIDTRELHSWNQSCKARWKILVMHHPLGWLQEWAERELRTILRKDFALCLSGHAHDQSSFHSINEGISLIECSAPPLFTSKAEGLGYSITLLSPEIGITDVIYRQWTKHQSFLSGVNFSNTDSGRLRIAQSRPAMSVDQTMSTNVDPIQEYFQKRLDQALLSFSSQPRFWVNPILRTKAEVTRDAESGSAIALPDLFSNPKSAFIKAPPQFGLTCLAHYLVKEAWNHNRCVWLYLDSKNLKPNTASIEQAANLELEILKCRKSDFKCVVLDSWSGHDADNIKILQRICAYFPELPVICMQTCDEIKFLSERDAKIEGREFQTYYLWSLRREQVREVVAEYNEARHIGDEDLITKRVVSDLQVMNIHRTPLNCLTLLKVSELDFDENPVNRTEMIKRVLFLLFNVDAIPTYKVRPDLKDCEYVLGYFCETLIKNDEYLFARDHFLHVLQEYCRKRLIDLEVHVVFDVLHSNNIIVQRGNFFCFRFSYWIFYFAAQRMHHDKGFASFIYEDMRYANFPEIIEFYTGIDRRREDALQVLARDIRALTEHVKKKCGLPEELNVYRLAQWRSSPDQLEQMKSEISEGVRDSNLPAAIKDQYDDRRYDRTRPYDQEVRNILTEYSFLRMIGATKAGARALRNSDYVDPEIKRQLLKEIFRSWEQASNVLLVLLPILAEKGKAIFDGVGFVLVGDFGNTLTEKVNRILIEIPSNIVSLCEDDLFSQKMGPLMLDQLDSETGDLRKHEGILLLIRQRPRGWKSHVHNYIASVQKNSFFLLDVYRNLRGQYRYSYASPGTLKDIEFLIKMAAIKHVTGTKEPGMKLINKLISKMKAGKDKDEPIVPPREV